MSVVFTEEPPVVDPPRKRWTRAEFEALSSSGVLDDQRVELVEGELISKMGKKRPHVNALTRLLGRIFAIFGVDFVNPEAPIDVAPEDNPTSEPEPDIIVLGRNISEITHGNPRPEELRLVIEVADTTLRFDLRTKASLYARAGIPDYWVLDVAGQRMIVHRDPGDGRYQSVVAYGRGESVAPLAAPDSPIAIGDLFQ